MRILRLENVNHWKKKSTATQMLQLCLRNLAEEE